MNEWEQKEQWKNASKVLKEVVSVCGEIVGNNGSECRNGSLREVMRDIVSKHWPQRVHFKEKNVWQKRYKANRERYRRQCNGK